MGSDNTETRIILGRVRIGLVKEIPVPRRSLSFGSGDIKVFSEFFHATVEGASDIWLLTNKLSKGNEKES